jgi:arabinan endo-1,5-alpha-L-arabinosidase
MPHVSEIHIRDPFVLPIDAEKLYYLYGTRGSEAWTSSATGIEYYTSSDLETWEGPFPAFRPPNGFWADRNFWAPEVHFYQGRYYMFASFKAEGVPRGTQILAADSPKGPFLPISKSAITPPDWECLDGTFFLDAKQQAWIVFCHEWVQVGDGEICAMALSYDLKTATAAPSLLFRASEAPWAEEINSKGRRGYVTDGPWMHRLDNGELLMLWSSFSHGDYAVGIAKSASGELLGPWEQIAKPLYEGDGGHCMTFRGFDGQLYVAFHRPNLNPNERPQFLPLLENGDSLVIRAKNA